jgi:hypothetical protein
MAKSRERVKSNAEYWRPYFTEKDRKAHVARLKGKKTKEPTDDLSGFHADLRDCEVCDARVLDIQFLEDIKMCLSCHSKYVRLDADSLQELLVELRVRLGK